MLFQDQKKNCGFSQEHFVIGENTTQSVQQLQAIDLVLSLCFHLKSQIINLLSPNNGSPHKTEYNVAQNTSLKCINPSCSTNNQCVCITNPASDSTRCYVTWREPWSFFSITRLSVVTIETK